MLLNFRHRRGINIVYTRAVRSELGCERAIGSPLSSLRFQNLLPLLPARFIVVFWRLSEQVSPKRSHISTKPHSVISYKNLTHVPSCLQMDNAGFEKDRRSAVEMGEVSSPVPEVPLATVNGNGVPGCTDACLALHQQHQKSLQQYQKSTTPRPTDSPWHHLKTIFLVTTVASLIVWVLVYTVLSQMAVVWPLHLARTIQETSSKLKIATLKVQSWILSSSAKNISENEFITTVLIFGISTNYYTYISLLITYKLYHI